MECQGFIYRLVRKMHRQAATGKRLRGSLKNFPVPADKRPPGWGIDALKLSFSAAPLVFLSDAARTGTVAPDFLLFLWAGSGRLAVCELFQKVRAYCLTRHFRREDLPAEVLNSTL